MAITTYAQLEAAVTNWLHRSDLGTYIPDFITLGEDRIYRSVRHQTMETALSGTITSSVLAVPSDYVQLRHAYINTTPAQALDVVSPNQIYVNYPNRSSTGKPKYIAREGSNFIFGPAPDSGYSVAGIYYKRFDTLSTSLNNLFLSHPGLWLYAALVESAPFLNDDKRILLWEQAFQKVVSEVNNEEEGYTRSGSLVMVASGL